MRSPQVNLELPAQFVPLLSRGEYRYKVAHGGRGSAKSWSFARSLVILSLAEPLLILCTREYQNSISDSVLRLLADQIHRLDLDAYFDVRATVIRCKLTGSEYIFKGLHHNTQEIKSLEGVDICWVEEGQSTSEDSWKTLIPTIRKDNSEIWLTFNPIRPEDPTCQRFIENVPDRALIVKSNWMDNPWFTKTLDEERRYMLRTDPDAYDHVWGGQYLRITAAAVFRNNYEIRSFETPEHVDRFLFGADWGFAQDPTTLVRGFIVDNTLYIDHEAYGIGIELDEVPAFFAGGPVQKRVAIGKSAATADGFYPGVPGANDWPIKADNARPETISYVARRGFNISAADKWQGSVEDGIAHIKGFDKVVIHERCKHTAEEFRLYSYKVDKQTGDILPVVVDKHNHCIDAIRYMLDGYIQRRGNLGVWQRLASPSYPMPRGLH